MKDMATYFHMRPGFDRFHLEPVQHRRLVIGKHDRRYRDAVLNGVEEATYGKEGYRAVIYGDFGRGKTHEANNIMWEIGRRKLPVEAVYVKCHEYKAKEPFSSLFSTLLLQIGVEKVNEVVTEYERRVQKNEADPIRDVVESHEIAAVCKGLMLPNLDMVRVALQWLGGSNDVDVSKFASGVNGGISLSRDFASVMRGFAHMFRVVKDQVLLFIIDEAERFGLVTHTDTYWSWVACLRAMTDLLDVGYVFYVGAKTKDQIPNMLTWDEVSTRIGGQNYRDLLDPGPDDLRQWIEELFQTLVRKGPLPDVHKTSVEPGALDPTVPEALAKVVEGDAAQMAAYPFTPAALDAFINQCVTQDLANRPREVLRRIQAATRRAMRHEKPRVDEAVLAEVQAEAW